MIPPYVLLAVFAVAFGLGLCGVKGLAGWVVPLRLALAAMFLVTATAHWGRGARSWYEWSHRRCRGRNWW